MPERHWSSKSAALLICAFWAVVGCTTGGARQPSSVELTPEGLAQWERQDAELQARANTAYELYQQDQSLEVLRVYELEIRKYLDHGFALYRSYRRAKQEPPSDLVRSLEQREALLMDVADEYIKQGSLAKGEGIAAEVVHDYSDLPALTPAQRRAEALLLRYRYRQDY